MRTSKILCILPGLRAVARAARTLGTAVLIVALSALGPLEAQSSGAAQRKLRYEPAQSQACGVRRGIVYSPAAAAGQSLSFDLYTPPQFDSERRLPVVVFVNGVGYRDLKDWNQYTGWARAMACEDLAAVTYQATSNRAADELELLMSYLIEHQAELSIDASNVAWWACSDNVLQALPLAMNNERRYLRCAVFYYGMPEQWPVIRPDLPLFVVKAGVDNPELNARIDRFALSAAAANVDMTYVVHASASHAFDVAEDSVRTSEIIQSTLRFVRVQLSPQLQSESEVAALERRARLAWFRSDWPEMARAYDALTRLKPESGESYFRLGFARLFLGQFKAAIPSFERAAELDFMRPSAIYNVACCRSRLGDIEGALNDLRRALEVGFENQALLKEDPDLANVRADPRFAQMLKEWLERRHGGDQKP